MVMQPRRALDCEGANCRPVDGLRSTTSSLMRSRCRDFGNSVNASGYVIFARQTDARDYWPGHKSVAQTQGQTIRGVMLRQIAILNYVNPF